MVLNIPKFTCKTCNKTFKSNSGLWYHSKKCGKDTCIVKKYKCPHCDYETTGPKCTLLNHINSKHTDEENRPFQCRLCNRGFAQKSHLHKHMSKIHNIDNPKPKSRNIVEYHIKILDKDPISNKTSSRIKLYRKHPIIKASEISSLRFYYTKILKPCHLHYDNKKGYISFVAKTKEDL